MAQAHSAAAAAAAAAAAKPHDHDHARTVTAARVNAVLARIGCGHAQPAGVYGGIGALWHAAVEALGPDTAESAMFHCKPGVQLEAKLAVKGARPVSPEHELTDQSSTSGTFGV